MGCAVTKVPTTYNEDTTIKTLISKLERDGITKANKGRYAITLVINRYNERDNLSREEIFQNARDIAAMISFKSIYIQDVYIPGYLIEVISLLNTNSLMLKNIISDHQGRIFSLIYKAGHETQLKSISLGKFNCPQVSLTLRKILNNVSPPIRLFSFDFGWRSLRPELTLTEVTLDEKEHQEEWKDMYSMLRALLFSDTVRDITFNLLFGRGTPLELYFDDKARQEEGSIPRVKQLINLTSSMCPRFIPYTFSLSNKHVSFYFLFDIKPKLFFSTFGVAKGVFITPCDLSKDLYGDGEYKEFYSYLIENQILRV